MLKLSDCIPVPTQEAYFHISAKCFKFISKNPQSLISSNIVQEPKCKVSSETQSEFLAEYPCKIKITLIQYKMAQSKYSHSKKRIELENRKWDHDKDKTPKGKC